MSDQGYYRASGTFLFITPPEKLWLGLGLLGLGLELGLLGLTLTLIALITLTLIFLGDDK